MAGPRVGIIGLGGVGVAAASAIVMRGLAGRLTFYARRPESAQGLALDFLHARPLLPRIEVRGRGLDDVDTEDILIFAAGAHTTPGQNRLELLQENIAVMEACAASVEASGNMPRVALVVTNPLDVMTELLTRRWAGRRVAVLGSGTALDTLRFTERVAEHCGVHPRSVHAWVVGEHGDSSVPLFASVTVGAMPLEQFAMQRHLDVSPQVLAAIEQDVRDAAYRVRDLKGSAVHGIGITVSGLIHALAFETGAIIPVSVRVGDRVCASLPCVLGPDGPSAPLMPTMSESERKAWEHTLEVLHAANAALDA